MKYPHIRQINSEIYHWGFYYMYMEMKDCSSRSVSHVHLSTCNISAQCKALLLCSNNSYQKKERNSMQMTLVTYKVTSTIAYCSRCSRLETASPTA